MIPTRGFAFIPSLSNIKASKPDRGRKGRGRGRGGAVLEQRPTSVVVLLQRVGATGVKMKPRRRCCGDLNRRRRRLGASALPRGEMQRLKERWRLNAAALISRLNIWRNICRRLRQPPRSDARAPNVRARIGPPDVHAGETLVRRRRKAGF